MFGGLGINYALWVHFKVKKSRVFDTRGSSTDMPSRGTILTFSKSQDFNIRVTHGRAKQARGRANPLGQDF